MSRRSHDRTPDRITLSHAGRRAPATGPMNRSRHLWTFAAGVAGSLVLLWVLAQLEPASSDAQTTGSSNAAEKPLSSARVSLDTQGKSAALQRPVADASEAAVQGPAIDVPQELLAMLDLRKQNLDRREQAIRREEERLLVLKAELESVLTQSETAQKQLEEARNKIQKQTAEQKLQQDRFIADRNARLAKQSQDQKNQNQMQLAKIYESMPAEEAAARLEQMPERRAVEMLRFLKGKTAGAILAQMRADRAAKLTEQLLASAP